MTNPAKDMTLVDFMRQAEAGLSLAERRLIVKQALLMLEQNYVHLPLKVAMHGVNPVQRLRVMLARLDRQTPVAMEPERDFHAALQEIFHSVRDLHTNYLLPSPFNGVSAYLPFLVERVFELVDDRPTEQYLVTAIPQWYEPPRSAAGFGPGVRVTHWNDVPIDRAVQVNAARFAGSNAAARHARGLDSLTVRPLIMHLPPDEERVTIRYVTPDGHVDTLTEQWRVAANPGLPDADQVNEVAAAFEFDLHAELVGQVRGLLFAPSAANAEDIEVAPPFRKVFRARAVQTAFGEFGHLRIWTFSVDDAQRFVAEFIRLVGLLPQNGLIIDVRGNGGGLGPAAEGVLQTLTPRRIEPQPAQFINSALNLRLCARNGGVSPGLIDLRPWYASMTQAVETGSVFSAAFPITSPADANAIGQRYHGPVVLITDARCYSATDKFAAGFQDHGIGKVLGTDVVTGAGGANVWTHQFLTTLDDFGDGGDGSQYRSLPAGTGMRVAIRRSLRVGPSAGTPVEDLGVRADRVHPLTRRDVLAGNTDLLDAAGRILQDQPQRRLELQSVTSTRNGDTLVVSLSVLGFDRLDVYADGRPWGSQQVQDGETTVRLEPTVERLRFEGHAEGQLVASLTVAVTGMIG